MDQRRDDPTSEKGCNLHRELDWVKNMPDAARKRQILSARDGIDETCPSRVDFSRDASQDNYTMKNSQDVKKIFKEAVLSMKSAVLSSRASPLKSKLEKWKDTVFPLAGWDLRRLSQQCELLSVSAFRVKGKLFMRVAVTNRPVDDFVLDYDRQVIEEWVKEDFQDSLNMTHPREVRSVDNESDFEVSTTLLEKWSGRAGLASHGSMSMDDNPAIDEALRQNSVAIDLAVDAVAVSNIAILILPLTMNLIPVAFLAELNTLAMLAYIMFTDVFSTLPFLVKGVELIRAVDLERHETVAYYVGDKKFGEIEVWNASCRGEGKFHAIGVSFVVIAVVAIVLGVFLEGFAGFVMRRRRRKEGSAAEGPFGRAAFDSTKLSLLGSGTDKDGLERRYSIDTDDVRDESDTETRQSSEESTNRKNHRWWMWGSKSASPQTASAMAAEVMLSVDSDVLSADVMARDGSYFSDEKELRRARIQAGSWMMKGFEKLLNLFGGSRGEESEEFSVGVGSDGMSSAERAARERGCEGYTSGYDEEEGGGGGRHSFSV
ncbi:unnamed protein product [Agarophyton chilense]